MEQYLKDLLKKVKLNEPTISTILGLMVIVVVIFLIFKYYRSQQSQTNMPTSEDLEQLELESAQNTNELPKTYAVQDGDTLWSISEKFYQSGYNWVDLAQANNLTNPNYLTTGEELSLPQVTAKVPEIAQAETTTEGQLATQAAMVQNSGSANTQAIESNDYVVQEGDYLWQIAVRAYGDGYKWTAISQANNLTNPDFLEVGQKLTLPR